MAEQNAFTRERLQPMRFDFDTSPGRTTLALIAILCLALQVRLMGLNWDGLAGLHPDERHLLFLTQAMFEALDDPANAGLSLADWWFSAASPLNPHEGTRFYVYGEAPLFAAMLAGRIAGLTDWFAFMPLARILASLADMATVLAVFLGARLLAGNRAGLAAALIYAAMPSALQLSGFHTVDVWTGAAVAAALVPMLALATGRWGRAGPLAMAGLAGSFFGLALACKVSALALAPAGLAALVRACRSGRLSRRRAALALGLAVLLAGFVFRLANPFAFAGPGFFGLAPSPEWLADFTELARFTASDDFPPNWQWIAGYGVLPLLRDFGLFGAGPVASLLFLVLLWRHPRGWGAVIVPLTAFSGFFLVMAFSHVSALRYAAPGLAALAMALAPVLSRLRPAPLLAVLAAALWWGAGAVRLHDGQHPRLAASHWLWTLPKGTRLTNETAWDEALPTIIALAPGEPRRWPDHDGWFVLNMLDMTAPDDREKARRIAEILGRTDYLVLSSDRQSAVMPRLPARFPVTTAHYRALFSGAACFQPVFTAARGYPLPFLGFRDDWAQEPWRVYDHPVVWIFKRLPCYDAAQYEAKLIAALDPN